MTTEDSRERRWTEAPTLRPYGFVESYPVIRRIGDRDLYLGNWRAADPSEHDESFEYVVSATETAYPLTTHHHPLIDGRENEWRDFERAVDATRRLYRADGDLLVHCKAGVSRSTTLLATTLAAEEGHDFHRAVEAVREVRPIATPNPALIEQAVVYLADQENGGGG